MKGLLDRIDTALQRAGLTRPDLADGIGISTQSLSNLRRRPGSSLSPEALAKTARFLRCDFFWLCTGEGGEYVPADSRYSRVALRVAQWLDAMSEADRMQALGYMVAMREGIWPDTAEPDPPAREP